MGFPKTERKAEHTEQFGVFVVIRQGSGHLCERLSGHGALPKETSYRYSGTRTARSKTRKKQ